MIGIASAVAHAPWRSSDHAAADAAATLLGRRGLRSKDTATRLALCAVHRLYGLPPGTRPRPDEPDPRTAVVGCSTFGGAASAARMAAGIRAEGPRGIDVMDAPNASTNALCASISAWFGLGGPCIQIEAGLDAGRSVLRVAQLLIRAGRATRVVVVAAEGGGDLADRLYGGTVEPLAVALEITRRPADDAGWSAQALDLAVKSLPDSPVVPAVALARLCGMS